MIFYMKNVMHRVKTNMMVHLVEVPTILLVSIMNKLYEVC